MCRLIDVFKISHQTNYKYNNLRHFHDGFNENCIVEILYRLYLGLWLIWATIISL